MFRENAGCYAWSCSIKEYPMFELEKDERIRGIDATTTALSMALAHDFILEMLLTREMLDGEPEEAQVLARVLVERWQRRYGEKPSPDFIRPEDGERVRWATKAFVDRLARKALARSNAAREAAKTEPQ